jgi:hypothetical protein
LVWGKESMRGTFEVPGRMSPIDRPAPRLRVRLRDPASLCGFGLVDRWLGPL